MSYRGTLIKLFVFAFVTVMLTAMLARTIHGFQDSHARTYEALFTTATRVEPGDDVRLAGVTVGRVSGVTLTDEDLAQVRFTVDDSVPLTTTSTVAIRYLNLIGERYLSVVAPGAGKELGPDSVIPVSRTRSALDLTAVFNGFQPLFQGLDSDAINTLSMSLVQALQGEGGTIASLLSGTGALGSTIAAHDKTIGRLVDELTNVLDVINTRSGPFNRLIAHLARFTRDLSSDRSGVIDALAAIDRLSRASGTLLQRVRPGLGRTIAGVGSIARQLDRNQGELARKLDLLPVKLNAITRSAQYGSWFQFYSCGMGVAVRLPGGGTLTSPDPPTRAPICGG